MNGFLQMIGRLTVAACVAAIMIVSGSAAAQDAARVERVSIDREAGFARIRVLAGATVRDVNRLARRFATEPGVHVDMAMIADLNPGQVIVVCHDELPGEAPYMSRDPEAWNACQHFPRERWLVAGAVYLVPLRVLSDPGAVDPEVMSAAEAAWRTEGLESRNRALESSVAELEEELATANDMLRNAALAEAARRERETRESVHDSVSVASDRSHWFVLIGLLLGLAIAFIGFYFVRGHWIAEKGRELEKLAMAIRAEALKSKRKLENALAVTQAKKDELNHRFQKLATLYGRRRSRTRLLLVQLAKYRKLLRQSLAVITDFQRRLAEEQARRERLPQLLTSVDDARRLRINANNARARVDMIRRWLMVVFSKRRLMAPSMRKITILSDLALIAQYRKEQKRYEKEALELEPNRLAAVETIYALTGIRSDHLDPESRFKRSIDAADKNAELLQAQTEALNELIQVQIAQQGYFDARERGIKTRETQLDDAEAEMLERIRALETRERDHAAQVDAWHKQIQVKKDLDAWTGAALKAETTGKLSEVERRMSEMEGRMSGYERRAVAAEKDLEETNDFLDKVRREFRIAKELIEGIKKGPNFLEARTAQMAEYIAQLEEKLGIERKSIWAGLPELAYGAIPPKNKA